MLGPNGCGKSCLLKSLAAREVAIPPHIDIYFLDREVTASDESALDCVKSVDEERQRLEAEADTLVEAEMTPEIEMRLEDVYARCPPPPPPLLRAPALASARTVLRPRRRIVRGGLGSVLP